MSYTYVVITITDLVWNNTKIYEIYKTKITDPIKFSEKVDKRIEIIRNKIFSENEYTLEDIKRFNEENEINYEEIDSIYNL